MRSSEIYLAELQRLHESGYLRTRNLRILAFNILGVLNWMLRWYRDGGSLSLDDVCDEVLSFVLYGALSQKASGAGRTAGVE